MRIIRTDLLTGKVEEVARYDGVTCATAHGFMVMQAQCECDGRTDIRHMAVTPDCNSGRSTVTLVDLDRRSVIEFRQEWPVEDDEPGEQ